MRTNNEEMKTPKQVVLGDAIQRALEATTTTKKTTEPFEHHLLWRSTDQAKAIQHCDAGKKKITIRFTPDSELISNKIKSTRQNPIVDLTFRSRKSWGIFATISAKNGKRRLHTFGTRRGGGEENGKRERIEE